MTLRNRLPEPLSRSIGFGSLLVMILGLAVGYILFMVGVSTYFGHTLPADDLSGIEALVITGIGIVCAVIGYFGWKGFLYFSY